MSIRETRQRSAAATIAVARTVATLVVAVLCVSGVGSQPAADAIRYSVVALTESLAFGPGLGAGVVFFNLRAPVINNAGHVAFYGGVDGTPIGPATIWRAENGSLTLLAGPGVEGPGPANLPGVNFLGFSVSQNNEGLNLSDGGHVSVAATLTGPGITSDNRDVLLVGTGPLAVLARSDVENELGPGVEATTTFATLTDLQFSLNDLGEMAFHSSLAGPLVTSTTNRGIWTSRGGALGLVARSGVEGAHGPGLGEGVLFTLPFAGGGDSGVTGYLNNTGGVVFRGTVDGPGIGSNNFGFWKGTPLGPQVILRKGDVVAGLGTVTNIATGGRRFGWNDAGQLAFPITVAEGPGISFSDVVRLETEPGTTLTSLARTDGVDGPLAPDAATLGDGHAFGSFPGDVSGIGTLMNAGGEVVFPATYSGPAGSGNSGVFLNANGVNRIVASTDFADDVLGPGLGPGSEFSSFSTAHLNACGQVVLEATVTSPTGTARGLWAWTGAGLRRVAFEGEMFDVDPTDGEDLRQIRNVVVQNRGSGGNDSRPRALNDHGVVVFLLRFEDLTWGIFTAELPLEGPAARCIPNVGPSADAGPNRVVRQGSEVTLSGAGSVDPDNGPEPLAFAWTQAAGAGVPLSDPTAADPRFTPTASGTYTFELVVSDGDLTSAPDATTITVPMLGDLDFDEDVDTDDLAIIDAALGSPASSANDLRDLNGDGTIDALDVVALEALCTRPECAVSDPPLTDADIGLAVSVSSMAPSVGDVLTFTLTITNHGPAAATGVVVREILANGYQNAPVPWSASQGTFDLGPGYWTVGALASGASATLTRSLIVLSTGTYNQLYSLIASEPNDPNDANDVTNVKPIPLTDADIGVTATANTLAPDIGDTVAFTVTVTNHGPAAATGVVVREILANGYQNAPVPWSASQGTFDLGPGYWTVGALASGASATLTRSLIVLSTGTYNQLYSRIASEPNDPNDTNDIRNVKPIPLTVADIGLALSVSSMTPTVGDHVTFTLTITNNGPAAATGVIVSESSASGYQNVPPGSSMSQGTYNSSTRLWAVGTLASGASATLTRHVTVRLLGSYTKTFTLSASNPADLLVANNSASLTPTVLKVADIGLALAVSTMTPAVGDVITFTLTVTNHGPASASDVRVWEFLSSGYQNATPGWSASQGTYSASGFWSIDTLASGASATLTRRVVVRVTGNYTKLFGVVSMRPLDLNIGNNIAVSSPSPE